MTEQDQVLALDEDEPLYPCSRFSRMDEGTGLPPSELERVFEPSYGVGASRSR